MPMITCNIEKPGTGSPSLPITVATKYIGSVFDQLKITGTLSKGSRIRVIAAKQINSVEDQIPFLEVEARPMDSPQSKPAAYAVFWLLNRDKPALGFDSDVARQIRKP